MEQWVDARLSAQLGSKLHSRQAWSLDPVIRSAWLMAAAKDLMRLCDRAAQGAEPARSPWLSQE